MLHLTFDLSFIVIDSSMNLRVKVIKMLFGAIKTTFLTAIV